MRMDNRSIAWFTAGAATSAALCALLLYKRLPQSAIALVQAKPTSLAPAPVTTVGLQDYLTDDVLAEQLTRNIQFFGTAGQDKIINSFVVVVGLGVSCH